MERIWIIPVLVSILILGMLFTTPVVEAASPVVNLINNEIIPRLDQIISLLTDSVFGLEEIKTEVANIEFALLGCGLPNVGDPCFVGTGACQGQGVLICSIDGSSTICSATAGVGTTETCNGIDDDCDGSIDEDFADLSNACSVGVGVCQSFGVKVCDAAQTGTECSVTAGVGSTETCNGIDDDCDGSIDDDFADLSNACSVGVGVCQSFGVKVCDAAQTGTECSVTAGVGTTETCNGLDDDCDGSIDDDFADLGNACSDGLGVCLVFWN